MAMHQIIKFFKNADMLIKHFDDFDLLNSIRDIWERYPFYRYRRITNELRLTGIKVNRKRVQRVMVWGSKITLSEITKALEKE
jgi:hypothetical protein